MKKLVRRWAGLLVFSVVMATLFINLGEWQWHKHHARSRSNAIIATNKVRAVQQFPAVFANGHELTDADQWQRISVTGTYDAAHQFQAMQRSTSTGTTGSIFADTGGDSTNGTEVITPLRTADGAAVLVDRGLIPRKPGQNDSSVLPAPPTGRVTVLGYTRRDEHGSASAITPVNHQMLLVNAPAIDKQLSYPIADGFLQLINSTPAQPSGMVMLAEPEQSGGPYLSYAIQWFMFTVIGVLGIVMIVRGDLRDRKKAERKQRIAALRAAAMAAADADHAAAHPDETTQTRGDAVAEPNPVPGGGATAADQTVGTPAGVRPADDSDTSTTASTGTSDPATTSEGDGNGPRTR